jgi:hypothetical protein
VAGSVIRWFIVAFPRLCAASALLLTESLALSCGGAFSAASQDGGPNGDAPSGSDGPFDVAVEPDGPATDGGSPGDALGDSTTGGSWCSMQPQHAFCDDFDDPNEDPHKGKFDGTAVAGGGVMPVLVTNPAYSAPNSLHGRIDQTTFKGDPVSGVSTLIQRMGNATQASIDFQVRLGNGCNTADNIVVVYVAFSLSTGGDAVAVFKTPATTVVIEQAYGADGGPMGTPTEVPVAPAFGFDEWDAVSLVFDGASKKVTLSVNGSNTAVAIPSLPNDLSHPSLELGAILSKADLYVGQCDVYVDNVLVGK